MLYSLAVYVSAQGAQSAPATSDAIIPLLITAVAAAVALLIIRKFRSGK